MVGEAGDVVHCTVVSKTFLPAYISCLHQAATLQLMTNSSVSFLQKQQRKHLLQLPQPATVLSCNMPCQSVSLPQSCCVCLLLLLLLLLLVLWLQVYGVDVGHGQVMGSIAQDLRVTVMEKTNLRHMTAGDLPEQVGTGLAG
jgi:hypothetical protein